MVKYSILDGILKKDILNHRRVEHEIAVTSRSFLKEIYGKNILKVNSFHSQAIDKVASTLKVIVRASDGTIEAIQSKEGSLYGIQKQTLVREKKRIRRFLSIFLFSVLHEKGQYSPFRLSISLITNKFANL